MGAVMSHTVVSFLLCASGKTKERKYVSIYLISLFFHIFQPHNK